MSTRTVPTIISWYPNSTVVRYRLPDGSEHETTIVDLIAYKHAAAPPQSEPADQLVLPEVIGPCSEIVERITDELGDIEGCETDQELVTQVLHAIKRLIPSGKITNAAAEQVDQTPRKSDAQPESLRPEPDPVAAPRNDPEGIADANLHAKLRTLAPALIAAVEALKLLHGNIAEYARINNLGGFDNQDMKIARAALAPFGENDEQKD